MYENYRILFENYSCFGISNFCRFDISRTLNHTKKYYSLLNIHIHIQINIYIKDNFQMRFHIQKSEYL